MIGRLNTWGCVETVGKQGERRKVHEHEETNEMKTNESSEATSNSLNLESQLQPKIMRDQLWTSK